MKTSLKNRPRPRKKKMNVLPPDYPDGEVYDKFLEAFEAELRQMTTGLVGNWILRRSDVIWEVLGEEGDQQIAKVLKEAAKTAITPETLKKSEDFAKKVGRISHEELHREYTI
jgi:hypothetical protein